MGTGGELRVPSGRPKKSYLIVPTLYLTLVPLLCSTFPYPTPPYSMLPYAFLPHTYSAPYSLLPLPYRITRVDPTLLCPALTPPYRLTLS